MQGKIAIEEHFAIDETLEHSNGHLPAECWEELSGRLLDFHGRRIEEMDSHGIETMILSLNAPAIQAIHDVARADEVARRANDLLAEQVAQNPKRFRGFAALPMQDPDLATRELERCVKELGFIGALVNGFSQAGSPDRCLYYDLPQYWPFWQTLESLDVPFYLHPRSPLVTWAKIYEGHDWMRGASWGFGQETATHALRLMGSGLFDACPGLKIIIGHLGECLPFGLWRIDNRAAWTGFKPGYRARLPIAEYFHRNFWITTSGNFRTQSLIDVMLEVGADRILFSADWPFENIDHAARWFDACAISPADRRKIGRTNAMQLFGL